MPPRRKPRAPRGRSGQEAQLRIIGGQWRGRKLAFTPAVGLRPTADRVRETLFNWLTPDIRDARCLDLFSGSGALGLEALSRGAASCDFVDSNGANLRQIAAHLQTLAATRRGRCHPGPAERFLARAQTQWDIVFLDPPFGQQLAGPACTQLQTRGLLAAQARIYLETGARERSPELPPEWQPHRDRTAGDVRYRLFHCPGPEAPAAAG
jgi:16S rRNA (guanine966-N2)-methyltransferase